MEHKLIIKSLHDAQAECACGAWQYSFTGAESLFTIQKAWRFHFTAGASAKYATCPKCGSMYFVEYSMEHCRQKSMRMQLDGEPNYDDAGAIEITGIDSRIEAHTCQNCMLDVGFLENDEGEIEAVQVEEDGTVKKGGEASGAETV